MAAEEERDIAALSRLINGSPGTNNFSPPTPEESEALVRMLQEKPSLISKLAETLSSGRHTAPTPAQREEKEAYMRQLENEGKVPEGKVLIRPKAGFVVKTFKMVMEGAEENGGGERDRVEEVKDKTKVFINVVTSDKLARPSAAMDPSSVKGKAGRVFTVPNVVGPSRMEEDKKGALVPTLDFCVHPDAVHLALSSSSSWLSPSFSGGGGGGGGREGGEGRGFKDLLVEMALESAVRLWQAEEDREGGRAGGKASKRRRRRKVEVDGEYIILRGCRYKVGKEPATLVVDSKSLVPLPPSPPPSLPSSLPPSKATPPPTALPGLQNSITAAATTTAAAGYKEEEAKEAMAVEHGRRMKTKVGGGRARMRTRRRSKRAFTPLPPQTPNVHSPLPSVLPPLLPPPPPSLPLLRSTLSPTSKL